MKVEKNDCKVLPDILKKMKKDNVLFLIRNVDNLKNIVFFMDILDNKKDKKVGEILRKSIKKDAKLSILSAYFTIYAYSELKKELSQIKNIRFLFLTPTFNKDEKDFNRREFFIDKRERERNILGDFYEIKLKNNLTSSGIAKSCANWIRD